MTARCTRISTASSRPSSPRTSRRISHSAPAAVTAWRKSERSSRAPMSCSGSPPPPTARPRRSGRVTGSPRCGCGGVCGCHSRGRRRWCSRWEPGCTLGRGHCGGSSRRPTSVVVERKSVAKDKYTGEVVADGASAADAARPETVVALRARDELAAGALKQSVAPRPAPAPAPAAFPLPAAQERAAAVARMVGPYALTGPPLTLDSARALVDTDPYAVPDLPVRGIYRARLIGFSAVVVVEQALDSSTAIDVITGRQAPLSLQAVVVTGAARADTENAAERALRGRAAAASDSIASAERKPEAAPVRARGAAANRPVTALVVEVRGPLSADSLAALERRLQPLRP